MPEEHLYRDQVLEAEPHGIEPIKDAERHGQPFNAFTLWFGANVEFATFHAVDFRAPVGYSSTDSIPAAFRFCR